MGDEVHPTRRIGRRLGDKLRIRFEFFALNSVNLCFTPRYLDGTGVVREQRMLASNTKRSVNHLRNGEPAA